MLDYKIEVLFKDKKINTNLKELVQYDYNSMRLNFIFDITGARYVFKLKGPNGNTVLIDDIVNNQYIIPAGVLNQVGYYYYEISVYDSNSKLTNYAKKDFYVREVLINTDEIVIPDDRVPVLDRLINEVNEAETQLDTLTRNVNTAITEANNLNIDISKIDKVATIELTKKDGSKKNTTIRDGYDLDYDWDGTSLGIKREDEEQYEYVDLKGDKGNTLFATFDIVNGDLIETYDEDFEGIEFSINNNGEMEVII